LLDVNQTLVTMLGYVSKERLLAANQESEIIPIFRDVSLSAGRIPEAKRIEPVEKEWKRKDGTKLKARLNGRGGEKLTWMSPNSARWQSGKFLCRPAIPETEFNTC
jgi:PAS domain-containing protein